VHGRRLERNEQLVATGVKLGLGDERYDLCGVTEAKRSALIRSVDVP
jgi:hypothetical protein